MDDFNKAMSSGTPIPRNTSLTPSQWKKQLLGESQTIGGLVAKLSGSLPPSFFDKVKNLVRMLFGDLCKY